MPHVYADDDAEETGECPNGKSVLLDDILVVGKPTSEMTFILMDFEQHFDKQSWSVVEALAKHIHRAELVQQIQQQGMPRPTAAQEAAIYQRFAGKSRQITVLNASSKGNLPPGFVAIRVPRSKPQKPEQQEPQQPQQQQQVREHADIYYMSPAGAYQNTVRKLLDWMEIKQCDTAQDLQLWKQFASSDVAAAGPSSGGGGGGSSIGSKKPAAKPAGGSSKKLKLTQGSNLAARSTSPVLAPAAEPEQPPPPMAPSGSPATPDARADATNTGPCNHKLDMLAAAAGDGGGGGMTTTGHSSGYLMDWLPVTGTATGAATAAAAAASLLPAGGLRPLSMSMPMALDLYNTALLPASNALDASIRAQVQALEHLAPMGSKQVCQEVAKQLMDLAKQLMDLAIGLA
jgi:hypothetical protein